MPSAITVRDADPHKFVAALAQHLKKQGEIKLPKWVDIVKTGPHKELPPVDPDWWYTRCAAIARNVYLYPGTGVGALRHRYGGPKRPGHSVRPQHHAKGSPAIARRCLQALEKLGLLKKDPKQGGRRITQKGQQDLDRIAAQVVLGVATTVKPTKPVETKKEEPKEEKKQ